MLLVGIEEKEERLRRLFNKIPITYAEEQVIEYFKGDSLKVSKNGSKIKVF